MRTIGQNVRALRQERGWSTCKLAAESGVPSGSICKYENDKMLPGVLNAIALADAFSISLDELVGRRWKNDWSR